MARKLTLALLDASALIHRAYHALPPMSTREGVPTNAVYGFTLMLLKMFQVVKPTHVVAAFDVKGPTFRKREYTAYKAHRKPVDEELIKQFDLVRDVLAAFSVPMIEKEEYEADDIIGTLTARAPRDVRKVIVTGDLDTLQLVDETTSVFTLKRGLSDTMLYTETVVRAQFGFAPPLIVDYKGLRGDPSDNIPGVRGIGEKTARELVRVYGTVENVYEHLDELTARVRGKLSGHKREALFSRKLATIVRDVPVTFSFEDAELASYDSEQVRELFSRLEFRSLLQRLPKGGSAVQPTLFQTAAATKSAALPMHYHIAETAAQQQELLQGLREGQLIAFDTETDSLGARQYPIVGMSIAIRRGTVVEAWYVPVNPQTVKRWKDLLENERVKKVGHNLKYDSEVLAQSGVELSGIAFDSMIASYLLHPGARQHSLDTLAVQELDYHPIPISDLIGSDKNHQRMSQVPLTDIARYACEDAEVAFRLYETLEPRMRAEGLIHVLEELELPLIPVLAHVELAGVRVDVAALTRLNGSVSERLSTLQHSIWQKAGKTFNINSTQQLRHVLYEELRLPTVGIARTQTGFSTAASELAKLHGTHAIVILLEEYRELSKLLNTYIEALPQLVDRNSGRIFASFNQTVAATGRLSSSDPNLQNIPVRSSVGQEIRAAFVAEKGYRFVKADYSQLELRIAAHLSRDDKMMDAFRRAEDIHRTTAAWVYGISPSEVTDIQRREAKTLNFGVLYGMGPQSFAQAADVSVEKARSFIERYREQHEGLMRYLGETVAVAHELGNVITLCGRKRPIPEIFSSTPAIRSQAERAAINFPVQGTAADILKKAMIRVYACMCEQFPGARMVLTVHDELVVEVPQRQAQQFGRLMKDVMEDVMTLDVPLVVDVSVGSNWRDTVPLS